MAPRDKQVERSLTHAGFNWDDVPDELRQDVLNQFRKDGESCVKDMEELDGIVIKGLSCTAVVGDADPDIPVIDEVQPRWNHYMERPINLVVLHGANHYFHRERAAELAEIIRGCSE